MANQSTEVRYRWRPGVRLSIDAQAAGERIEALSSSIGRALQRGDILEDARREDSPFRDEVFRDEDGEAAEKWRLEVCGRILRGLEMVTIHYEEGVEQEISVPQPVVIHVERIGYERTAKVMSDADMRRMVLDDILNQLRAYRTKLERFTNLARLMDGVIAEAESMISAAT